MMLAVVVFVMVLTAASIIGGVVYWGFRNGTLSESDQERFDRRFDEIVAADLYATSSRHVEP